MWDVCLGDPLYCVGHDWSRAPGLGGRAPGCEAPFSSDPSSGCTHGQRDVWLLTLAQITWWRRVGLVPPNTSSCSPLPLFPPVVFEGTEGTAHTSGVQSPLHLPKGRPPAYMTWNSSAWESCLFSPLLIHVIVYFYQPGLMGVYFLLRCTIRCSFIDHLTPSAPVSVTQAPAAGLLAL